MFPSSLPRLVIVVAAVSCAAATPRAQNLSSRGERWAFLQQAHDANGDGVIAPAEYSRGDDTFRRLDRNRDGVIDERDFQPLVRRLRIPSGHRHKSFSWTALVAVEIAKLVDRDRNGEIPACEWHTYVDSLGANPDGVIDRAALPFDGGGRFARMASRLLDIDEDGDVTVTDLRRLFDVMDKNHDGTLQRSELGVLPWPGELAPDFELPMAAAAAERVRLSSFRNVRPVALIFGSYTSQPFRASAGRLAELYERYHDRVAFYVIYIREAHAVDSRFPGAYGLIEDPISFAERAKVATRCVADLELPMTALVDGIDDRVSKAYGAAPDRLYLIGRDGAVAYAGGRGPFIFSPDQLAEAIRVELEREGCRRR